MASIVEESKAKILADKKANAPTYNKKQVFWAILPWSIIVIVTVGFAGIVSGWTLKSGYEGQVRADALVVLEDLKVKE